MKKSGWRVVLEAVPAAALFCVVGCGFRRAGEKTTEPPQVRFRGPLRQLLAELDGRFTRVRTVRARLDVLLVDNNKRKDYELDGKYFGDAGGNLRLQIQGGGHTVMDLAFNGVRAYIHLPRKKRFLYGGRRELLDASENEFSLLAHAGQARDLFFPRPWTKHAVERRLVKESGREVINVIEQPAVQRVRVRRITLSPDLPVIESQEVFNRRGRYVGLIEYFDYRFPSRTPVPDGTEVSEPYPRLLRLTGADGRWTLQLKVVKLEVNKPIPARNFRIRTPAGLKAERLSEFLKRGAKFWE